MVSMGMMTSTESILAQPSLSAEADKIMQDLNNLQTQLKTLNAWPSAGDEFLTLIPKTDNPEPISEKEGEWIPQVVKDCLDGIDIGFRYPSFFQRLLMNSTLRNAFMDALEQKLELRSLI